MVAKKIETIKKSDTDPAAPGKQCSPGGASAGKPHFFHTLPMDIQVCVLQTWLGEVNDPDRLVALSALDIACCNKALRPALLDLTGHPLNIWTKCATRLASKDLRCFILWLAARQVHVTGLVLTDTNLQALAKNPFGLPFLPSVENIMLYSSNVVGLYAVLNVCPHADSLEGSYSDGLIMQMWNTFRGFRSLTTLTCWGGFGSISKTLNAPQVQADYQRGVATVGYRLKQVQFSHVVLTNACVIAIRDHCPDMRKISANVDGVAILLVLEMASKCNLLHTLMLEGYRGTVNECHAILHACSAHLQQFNLIDTCWQCSWQCRRPSLILSAFLSSIPG